MTADHHDRLPSATIPNTRTSTPSTGSTRANPNPTRQHFRNGEPMSDPTIIDQLGALLASPMTQRSLLAAVIVGLAAPVIGTYLVQRRLSLLGDGIGHVALTGVVMGWLVGAATGATDLE